MICEGGPRRLWNVHCQATAIDSSDLHPVRICSCPDLHLKWETIKRYWYFLFLCCAVQHQCIPQAILGMDVLCQAKSGMGKTAVFVLSVLQQLEPQENQVAAVIVCHTRELAYQVIALFDRNWTFSWHILTVRLRPVWTKPHTHCIAGSRDNWGMHWPALIELDWQSTTLLQCNKETV